MKGRRSLWMNENVRSTGKARASEILIDGLSPMALVSDEKMEGLFVSQRKGDFESGGQIQQSSPRSTNRRLCKSPWECLCDRIGHKQPNGGPLCGRFYSIWRNLLCRLQRRIFHQAHKEQITLLDCLRCFRNRQRKQCRWQNVCGRPSRCSILPDYFGNKNDPGALKRIQHEIIAVNRDYVSKVNVKALVTLLIEHFNAKMRSIYDMPTVQ